MIKGSAFLKTVGKKMNNTYNSILQGSNVFQTPWSKKCTHPNTVLCCQVLDIKNGPSSKAN